MPLTLYYPENAMRLLNFISFVSDNHAGNNEEMLMYVYFGSIVNQQNPWIPCFKCRNENVLEEAGSFKIKPKGFHQLYQKR